MGRICDLDNCSRPYWANGMCSLHEHRVQRYGHPEPAKIAFAALCADNPYENWRPIDWSLGNWVSDYGRFWSMRGQGYLRKLNYTRPAGRPLISLSPPRKWYSVGCLVLEVFVGPRPKGMVCCHWDDNPANNHLSNLRWDTYSANEEDKKRNRGWAPVTYCINGHEYTETNTQMTSQGKKCRTCKNELRRIRYATDSQYREAEKVRSVKNRDKACVS